jgi:predicted house-cleaning noncanonical NTP pyrophosphatase (MazG superfamily)
MVEEAKEFCELDECDPHSRFVEELADTLETIDAIKKHLHITDVDLATAKFKKYDERGGYIDGIMLEIQED